MTDKAGYVQWLVFRALPGAVTEPHDAGRELETALRACDEFGAVRGLYDLRGLRADADWMLWWQAAEHRDLRRNLARIRRTVVGRGSQLTWSAVAPHRPDHLSSSSSSSSSAAEATAPRYACVHPLVRSFDWYLLPGAERDAMLGEQAGIAADFPDVSTTTAAAFALGDVEWIVVHRSDRLDRIADAARALRASADRRHVREDTPTFTGCRTTGVDLALNWP